tara:strand:+ start:84 stop:680 length:597 start_codon:yes stop_codon:yes gene_type:complete
MDGSGPDPGTDCPPSPRFKLGVTLFIILNILAALQVNRPSPKAHYQGDPIGWLAVQYAHLVGLGQRWRMFSVLSHDNYWYHITANYVDGQKTKQVVLPLPLQSERTFLQYNFFDSTEGKFHYTIYGSTPSMKAWSRYLCRTYPEHEGMPIESIVFEIKRQNILDPEEARKQERVVEPTVHTTFHIRFKCPCEQKDDGS